MSLGAKRSSIWLGLAFAGILAAAAIFAPPPASAGYGSFAECIRASGAVFYDAHWCGQCVNQRKMFRGYANRLKVVSCYPPGDSSNIRRACESEGIKSFPTWIFGDGSRRVGAQSIEELARLTGCAAP